MKKMLMAASVASMIGQFNLPNIKLLKSMGYEVHVACNFEDQSAWTDENNRLLKETLKQQGIHIHQIGFSRNVCDMKSHYKAYRQLLHLLRTDNFDFIHCHTPICAALSRLAAFFTKTKVIYTAHGFQFYQGAPIKDWLLYFPVEWICSWLTDILITINKEDYTFAKHYLHAINVRYVSGVGVDLNQFRYVNADKEEFHRILGIPAEAKIILSVGELSRRKNHSVVIKALAKLKDKNLYYIICGRGKRKSYLEKLAARLGVSSQVKLLGYHNDISVMCSVADIFVFLSYREGLPVALMEAMASGLPCIASDIRGNRDLICNNENGYLVPPKDYKKLATTIKHTLSNIRLQNNMVEKCYRRITKFSLYNVNNQMERIYTSMSKRFEGSK